jgi:hypothetical protein
MARTRFPLTWHPFFKTATMVLAERCKDLIIPVDWKKSTSTLQSIWNWINLHEDSREWISGSLLCHGPSPKLGLLTDQVLRELGSIPCSVEHDPFAVLRSARDARMGPELPQANGRIIL